MAIEKPEKSTVTQTERSTRVLFEHKKVYKEKDSVFDSNIPLVDITDVRQLYGKINPDRRAIYLTESNLKIVSSQQASQPIYLMNFVARAFKQFRGHMQRAALSKRINVDSSVFFSLQPARGWTSALSIHNESIKKIYVPFATGHLSRNNLDRNIINFDSFMDVFMNYMISSAREDGIPLTLSGFMNSSFIPIHCSGLVIDLFTFNHNNDQAKNQLFLEDPYFEFYKNTAKKFGFVVDKNAPWRLIADLSSIGMKKYMYEAGQDYKTVFEDYFYETINFELEIFKRHAIDFYKSIVDFQPTVTHFEFCPRRNITLSKTITRAPVMEEKYSDLYWLEKYLLIRAAETKSNLQLNDIEIAKINIMRMLRTVDMRRIMLYIDDLIQKNSTINMNMFKQEDWQDFEYIPPAPNNVAANVIKDNLLVGEDAASKFLGVDISFIDEALDDSSE